MKKYLVLIFTALTFALPASMTSAAEAPTVTCGDLKFEMIAIRNFKGLDVLQTPEQRKRRLQSEAQLKRMREAAKTSKDPKLHENLKKMEAQREEQMKKYMANAEKARKQRLEEEARGGVMSWLDPEMKYMLVEYRLTNNGPDRTYVSPIVRRNHSLLAKADEKTILRQARKWPMQNPPHWMNPGVITMKKGVELSDFLVFQAPGKGVKRVDVEILLDQIFPDSGLGVIKCTIKLDDEGKCASADSISLKYAEAEKKKPDEEYKIKGKAKFGKVVVDVTAVTPGGVNVFDNGLNFVTPLTDNWSTVEIKITNKSSKEIEYTPLVFAKEMPGVGVLENGRPTFFLRLGGNASVVEYRGLTEAVKIPGKGEYVDRIIVSTGGTDGNITLALMGDKLLGHVKKIKGSLLVNIERKQGKTEKVSYKVVKKPLRLGEKQLKRFIDTGIRAPMEKFLDKFGGRTLNGYGYVFAGQFDEKIGLTQIILVGHADKKNNTLYEYFLMIPGRVSYLNNDKVMFQGIITGISERKDAQGVNHKQISVFVMEHKYNR